ncbi:MAG: hypothetical protein CV045_13050, partial [Cyanobacteria bacterium M5B4]
MTTSPTITYTLEEFLMRFEQKIDRQFADLKQEISGLKTELKQDIKELNQKMDKQYMEIKQEISSLS